MLSEINLMFRFQLVMVTDGGMPITEEFILTQTFAFPIQLHIVIINSLGTQNSQSPWELFGRTNSGTVHHLSISSSSTAAAEFNRFAVENLQLPALKLQLGCISAYTSVYPSHAIFS